MASENPEAASSLQALHRRLQDCRDRSVAICDPLDPEDTCIQTMPDVSPPKWHLAHTTWFFETFILAEYEADYQPFHTAFDHLFNSYYVTHGDPYPRPRRGLLSRPTLREVLTYRDDIDARMGALLASIGCPSEVAELVELGINHEQQHQELMYTDIKHIFSCNPLHPAYIPGPLESVNSPECSRPIGWKAHPAGIVDIGHEGDDFAFDNEGPQHKVLLRAYEIADRLITNAEYRQFIDDGGYQRPELWMSEGWALVKSERWQHPLYWHDDHDEIYEFTLHGMQVLRPEAPVAHVSFYEADAYARWAGVRLPTEAEWETAAAGKHIEGGLRDAGSLTPQPTGPGEQFFGDVWEWTASPYTAYPGYQPASGSIGEYNGKFMSNQMVLRGGSCVTPADHIRASYRNFFYPGDRWQFSGIRLARDV